MMKVGDVFEQNVNGMTVGLGKINMSTEAPSLVNSIESGEKFLGRKSDDGERCGERWPIPGTWTVLQEKRGRDGREWIEVEIYSKVTQKLERRRNNMLRNIRKGTTEA